jgi:branched-subunit amino acid transport protein
MTSIDYILIIAGMGLVTYLPRWLPFWLLANRRLHPTLEAWLDLIPVAILSALLLPALVTSGAPLRLDPVNLRLLVAIPTLGFALRTRSLGGTVVVGMALFWLGGALLPELPQ